MEATFRHTAAVSIAVLVAALSATALAAQNTPSVKLARSCTRDPARTAACQLIVEFFEAANRGRYGRACSLLGERLLRETGGPNCPKWLAYAGKRRFQVMRARTASAGVEVLVQVELPELDHSRMLGWWALVSPEAGRLKIIETRRA